MDPQRVLSVEQYVLSQLKDRGACLAIGLVDPEGLIYSRGFGPRDLLLSKPATPDTLFGVGSITKSFTALSTILLEEEGRLSLDDPVSTHLGQYRLGGRSQVLIKHLLTHTSGIPSLGVAEKLIEDAMKGARHKMFMDELDFVDWVNRGAAERVCEPGEKFMYWNEGYMLLGRIIEKVSGVDYRRFVRDRLLEPMVMRRSGFGAQTLLDPDSMEPYVQQGKRRLRVAFPDHPLLDAAGGLISSVSDLYHYLDAYLSGTPPLDGATAKKLCEPRVKSGLPTPLGTEYYGYGWIVNPDFYGHTLVYHSGNIGVSAAYVGFVPQRRLGVIVLTNTENIQTAYVGAYALACLLGIDVDDLAFLKYQRLIENLSGAYRNVSGTVTLELKAVGPVLYATFTQEGTSQTFPVIMDHGSAHIVVGVERIPVELVETRGSLDLLIERNRFHRVQ
jgi:CubicO group peptidase (beta-lactamase class C family)